MAEDRLIQSVARALSILELYDGPKKAWGVTEIATALDLSKSTAFSLIRTLANKGYLEQNLKDSRYSLGLKLLRMGALVRSNSIIATRAHPYLEELVDEFSETVHLAVEKNGVVVYIEKIMGVRAIFMQSDVGAENPMYCTGVGKCLLAHMPEARVDKILRQISPMKRLGLNTITDVDVLRKELEVIRERGISFDDEEYAPGLICIAAPIRTPAGEVVAAISLSGAKAGISSRRIAQISDRIRQVAEKIGAGL